MQVNVSLDGRQNFGGGQGEEGKRCKTGRKISQRGYKYEALICSSGKGHSAWREMHGTSCRDWRGGITLTILLKQWYLALQMHSCQRFWNTFDRHAGECNQHGAQKAVKLPTPHGRILTPKEKGSFGRCARFARPYMTLQPCIQLSARKPPLQVSSPLGCSGSSPTLGPDCAMSLEGVALLWFDTAGWPAYVS